MDHYEVILMLNRPSFTFCWTIESHFLSMSGVEHKSGKIDKTKKNRHLCDCSVNVDGDSHSLIVQLPSFQYNKIKFSHVPLDRVRTDGLKFDSLHDAMTFIKGHCMFHFGKFNFNLAKSYIRDCYVYDPYVDVYISQENINIKCLRVAFKQVDY